MCLIPIPSEMPIPTIVFYNNIFIMRINWLLAMHMHVHIVFLCYMLYNRDRI